MQIEMAGESQCGRLIRRSRVRVPAGSFKPSEIGWLFLRAVKKQCGIEGSRPRDSKRRRRADTAPSYRFPPAPATDRRPVMGGTQRVTKFETTMMSACHKTGSNPRTCFRLSPGMMQPGNNGTFQL